MFKCHSMNAWGTKFKKGDYQKIAEKAFDNSIQTSYKNVYWLRKENGSTYLY